MRIWKHTPLDAIMVALSAAHLATTVWLASTWSAASPGWRLASFALVLLMTIYSVIVITHLFTHTPWFQSHALNALGSMLHSINIGQSAKVYELMHVRNHHCYGNDRRGPDGQCRDFSSTFQEGRNGQHASLARYAFLGAFSTLDDIAQALLSATRAWRVGPAEQRVLDLLAKGPARARERRQVQLDRMAHFVAVAALSSISWEWMLACYLPAYYLALAFINVQNYYEHYGATPDNQYADSVSYYGRLYNLLTFNDGYHQEHHLRPGAHWSRMPAVRRDCERLLSQSTRVVSPVPAIVGFLHRGRPQLDRVPSAAQATAVQTGGEATALTSR